MVRHTENRKTDSIFKTNRNKDSTKYDPYLSALECDANEVLYNQHWIISVDYDVLGKSQISVQKNPVTHFHSIEE